MVNFGRLQIAIYKVVAALAAQVHRWNKSFNNIENIKLKWK